METQINNNNQEESNQSVKQPTPDQPAQPWFSEYGEAFKDSFLRSWKNRWLWFWGILLPAAGFNFNTNFGSGSDEEAEQYLENNSGMIEQWLGQYWMWLVGLAVLIFVIMIVFWLLSAIARGGVIKTLDELQEGIVQKRSFGEIWKAGKAKMMKIMGLDLLTIMVVLLVLSVLSVPIIILGMAGNVSSAVFLTFVAIIIFLVLVFVISYTKKIAEILIVLNELKIGAAVENGYKIFKKNIKEAFKLLLFLFFVGFLHGIATMIGIVIIGIVAALILVPLGIINFSQSFNFTELFNSGGGIAFVVIAVLFALIIFSFVLLLKGITAIWTQDVWVWWTKKVGKMKTVQEQEEVGVEEESVAKKPAIEIEGSI